MLSNRCETHWFGNPAAARMLRVLGADKTLRNKEGLTALGQVLVSGSKALTVFMLSDCFIGSIDCMRCESKVLVR